MMCYQVKRNGEDIKGCRWATEATAKFALEVEIGVEYMDLKNDPDLEADVEMKIAPDGRSGVILLIGHDDQHAEGINYTISKIVS